MFWLFAATSFLSAGLLFLVQPLLGKLLLPTFGGAPTVWTASLLFFQTALLLGYALAHVLTRLAPRRLGPVYVAALALASLTLPITVERWPVATVAPAAEVLLRLTGGVGLPFIVLSAASPLLQRAYAVRSPDRDPYILYAASNAGSFMGLLAYPFLIEPLLSGGATRTVWSLAFVGAAVLLAFTVGPARASEPSSPSDVDARGVRPTRLLWWAGLAALPVSLLLGTTTFITTDVAAVPLLWVAPLAIYLLTFVVSFGPRSAVWTAWARRLVFPAAVAGVAAIAGAFTVEVAIAVLLAMLAVLGIALHGELYRRRPAPRNLTLFYLVVATGGASGGLFNAIVAPLVFPTVIEFHLALGVGFVLLAALPRPEQASNARVRITRMTASILLGAGAIVLATAVVPTGWAAVLVGTAGVLVLGMTTRGWDLLPLALTLTALLVAPVVGDLQGLLVERSFFGSYRVEDTPDAVRLLHQGTTLHGSQDLNQPAVPQTYYHPDGPVGDLIALVPPEREMHLGVVGLGAGSLVEYGDAGDLVTFHEIDPKVVEIAQDPELFTYLTDAEAEVQIVLGDGRLTLADAEPNTYDLLVLDAFSSDAVPAHLLTIEAFEIYGRALRPGGVLAVHISNRHLDLAPVVESGSNALGWSSAIRDDTEVEPPRTPSTWVALSSDVSMIERLTAEGWDSPAAGTSVRWTDDYSNILSVLD